MRTFHVHLLSQADTESYSNQLVTNNTHININTHTIPASIN